MIQIILAGILALPSLLLLVATAPLIALLAVPSLLLLTFRKIKSNSSSTTSEQGNNDDDAHAIVTGGSSGIGLGIAMDCVKRGMSKVTIIARTKSKLEAAKKQLEDLRVSPDKTTIEICAVNVSDVAALQEAAKSIFENSRGKTFLFCNAGKATPSHFSDISPQMMLDQVNLNQLGAIYTVQAFLPYMTAGTISLTSSMGGQVGIFGFSSYSPTKFALRGFAEVLHMELATRPIHVQLAFPPDTDTPGYEEEIKMQPVETKLISDAAGLSDPKDIARSMVQSAMSKNPPFFVYFTFEGWMLSALTAGMSPVSGVADALAQVALVGLFRFVALFFLNDWWRIIGVEANKSQGKSSQPSYGSISESKVPAKND